MKRFFHCLLPSLLILQFFSSTTIAQTFIGSTIDGHAGVHSLLLNPATAVDSKMRWDINLISTSAFVGSDYLSVDLSNLNSFRNGFEIKSEGNGNSSNHNNFFGNVDILGPSVLFNLDHKNSFAFTTRARAFFNITNVGGDLYELVNLDYNDRTNFNLTMEDASGLVHAWAEIGATYGRLIIEDGTHALKAGITLKHLAGAGGTFGSSQMLHAQFDNESNLLTTSGVLNYGHTSGFDSNNITFSDIKSGFGTDIGLVYEFKQQHVNTYYNPYKFKIGLSVMDVGAVNYDKTNSRIYTMNASVNTKEFELKNLEEVLEDNFEGTELITKTKIGLPTSLQMFVDYNIDGKFFVSAQGAISIKNNRENPVNNLINSFTVTPRFEKRWISVYSPFSVRQYDSSLAWGIGVRAGPVIVGSGSIWTNLISNNSKSTDVYVGIKVPLYK
ncbi:hypothetical protein J2X69_001724 [Algoriphagus sp. 4150]|uniref:hypothetical protein n=1 Tax=Algoriphagus sp. 4150 TaxID=2817756 RepID=UPI002865AFAD|nr:hypothetical protein [Algoriphagus sp. 4150]MDR7129387.1 hypothetical protein [Algoriphagus sp. 4150]